MRNYAKRLIAYAAQQNQSSPMSDSPESLRTRNAELLQLRSVIEQWESRNATKRATNNARDTALGCTWEQVQLHIPSAGVLLEFLRYRHYVGRGVFESRYGMITLSSKNEPRWIPLGEATNIDHALDALHTNIRKFLNSPNDTKEKECVEHLRYLYKRLIEPVKASIPRKAIVLIAPDSNLHFCPFATLMSSDKHFLIEDFAPIYLGTGRDLLREGSLLRLPTGRSQSLQTPPTRTRLQH